MIKRILEETIAKGRPGKAVLLLGPRQTGKTTLIKKILSGLGEYLFLDCDDPVTRGSLEDAGVETIRQIIGTSKIVFIDEAQRLKNSGLTLKMITDRFKDVSLFVSGSSSLDIRNQVNEPLTGRKTEYFLFPLSWAELYDHFGHLRALGMLPARVIFGSYPEVINNPGNEREILRELSSSYLYKDMLSYQGIRKPEVLEKLLQALAFQVGSEVSYNELSRLIQVDKNTISSYIDLLEKAFVIFRLGPLRRNLRSEIGTTRKIYFYDNGIRNALISNFNPLNLRQDAGALWENFLLSERIRYNNYRRYWCNSFFWRTKDQQEVDYLEEMDGNIQAYEFKLSSKLKIKIPVTFKKAYPGAGVNLINYKNFHPFLYPESIHQKK